MADIEQARLLTCPVVGVDNAQIAVLHRHLVASKRHELCAILCVKLIEARPAQLAVGGRSGRRGEAHGGGGNAGELAGAASAQWELSNEDVGFDDVL